ncbi:MAG TPA: hypothetical protein PLT36_00370 [Erysipelotrichaceae bacterium]|nr:hypothetical protein [Erysipelotrichaceae bacterium]HQA84458.1 hypothetical protein [Erysipelotrichaceae bacterium]
MIVMFTLLLVAGCNKKIVVNEETETLKIFAQSCAEEYLEINNLYDENKEYYISYPESEEPVYEYYLFCDENFLAKIELSYSEEIQYFLRSFKYKDGFITGTVIEENDKGIKMGSDKIYLNDSIEMNYITNIKVEKFELSEEQVNKMRQKAIDIVETDYLADNKENGIRYQLISPISFYVCSVAMDKETLLMKESNMHDYVLLKDGTPVFVIRLDATNDEQYSTSEYNNHFNIDFSKTENLKKVFMLVGGRYYYSNVIVISDNDYLNSIYLDNQLCITFITKKAYEKAFEILEDIDELTIIKSWEN